MNILCLLEVNKVNRPHIWPLARVRVCPDVQPYKTHCETCRKGGSIEYPRLPRLPLKHPQSPQARPDESQLARRFGSESEHCNIAHLCSGRQTPPGEQKNPRKTPAGGRSSLWRPGLFKSSQRRRSSTRGAPRTKHQTCWRKAESDFFLGGVVWRIGGSVKLNHHRSPRGN